MGTYAGVVNGELAEAVGEDVAVRRLGTETDLHSAGVGLEAAADARVDTAGAAPRPEALPGHAHELVALVAQELLDMLLDLARLAERDSHLARAQSGTTGESRRASERFWRAERIGWALDYN